jgi:WhiB family transcriptional regulator, redox-sensing transcriptional regulator
MTLDQDAASILPAEQEGLADPRPAWERIAYTWLEREVDHGQPVDPTALAQEVSVAPKLAQDLVRVLRADRDRDPTLSELRGRLVRDRITDAYLRRQLRGGGRLDPAELAVEVGTSAAVARQWLAGLRAQHPSGQGLEVLGEPVSHGRPTAEQLAGLQAHFAAGGHQQTAVTGRPADPERLAAEVERHYWTREVRGHERLQPGQLARELGGNQRSIGHLLAQLRAGPATAAERIEQLWQTNQQDPTGRPLRSSQLAWRLGVSDSYVRHLTWQLRRQTGQPLLAERLAATRQQLASPPPPVPPGDGRERDWRLDAACATVDPELFFPEPGQAPQATAAKAVCAGCAVRGPCLEQAMHGPQAHQDHAGIFAGTTPSDRVRLRARASMAQGTRFLQDPTAAEHALALANQVSIDRAARQLGVSKQALRHAFDHHDLPQPQVFQGGPQRTRFYQDRQAAEQAWQRAAEVGINQTRKELGVSDRHYAPPGGATTWAYHPALPVRRRPPGGWTRRSWPSTAGCSRPGNARPRSWPPGSAGRRSTPPWAPAWWSSSTARAAPAGRPPAPGRSPAAPNVPTTAAVTANTAASAARPTAPAAATVPADPTRPSSGSWVPIPASPAAALAADTRYVPGRPTAIQAPGRRLEQPPAATCRRVRRGRAEPGRDRRSARRCPPPTVPQPAAPGQPDVCPPLQVRSPAWPWWDGG